MVRDYSSHVPVVHALCTILEGFTVLELGIGQYSTPLWARYADLLLGIEDDWEWYQKVSQDIQGKGVSLQHTSDSVAFTVQFLRGVGDFDVIFVDDSRYEYERVETIKAVGLRFPTGITLIHDFDYEAYRDAALPFWENAWAFQEKIPWTGVLVNGTQHLVTIRKLLDRIEMEKIW
jgi:hypothetical protein